MPDKFAQAREMERLRLLNLREQGRIEAKDQALRTLSAYINDVVIPAEQENPAPRMLAGQMARASGEEAAPATEGISTGQEAAQVGGAPA